ncbi:MAG: M23 family metallopeptidase, partial [Actinobacteria bacterium]|nr:M23 family metallopeptidase [Actinomycetota bacterium]
QLYMSGGTLPSGFVLTAAGPRQAARRSGYAAAISRADDRALAQTVRARDAVTARWRELGARRGRLRAALRDRREALVTAARQRRRRRLVLVTSTRRLGRLQARETRLESESRRLAALGGGARVVGLRADRSTRLPAGATTADGGWTWPASGPLTSGFGMRWGSLHGGIDVGAPEGAPIVAASDGVVRSAGYESGYGNMVVVDHGGGITTAYAHQSSIATAVGAHVGAGDHIGSVGSTGNVTGPHLHFEVRVGGSPVDPMGYLP